MGIFDFERAKNAYEKKADYNINEMMSKDKHFTEHDELKIHDHRTHYLLNRIATALEKIAKDGK